MVKLTAELIEQAAQYTNAVRDRELDLRGESGSAEGLSRASVRGLEVRARPRARWLELGPRACSVESHSWLPLAVVAQRSCR